MKRKIGGGNNSSENNFFLISEIEYFSNIMVRYKKRYFVVQLDRESGKLYYTCQIKKNFDHAHVKCGAHTKNNATYFCRLI